MIIFCWLGHDWVRLPSHKMCHATSGELEINWNGKIDMQWQKWLWMLLMNLLLNDPPIWFDLSLNSLSPCVALCQCSGSTLVRVRAVFAYSAPSHHLIQQSPLVYLTLRNKLQQILNLHLQIFCQENVIENGVCKMVAILSWGQFVKLLILSMLQITTLC